jgi:hypothetical protein
VYCHCAYAQVVPADVKQQVLRELTDRDVSFEAVADLCEMAARRDPALARIAGGGPVRLAACYPRAVKWLFVSAGAPLPDDGVEIINMRTATAEQAATTLLRDNRALSPEPSALHAEREVTS